VLLVSIIHHYNIAQLIFGLLLCAILCGAFPLPLWQADNDEHGKWQKCELYVMKCFLFKRNDTATDFYDMKATLGESLLLTVQLKSGMLGLNEGDHRMATTMRFVCMASNLLEDQDQQFFYNGIRALEKCWTKCITVKGDYWKMTNVMYISCG